MILKADQIAHRLGGSTAPADRLFIRPQPPVDELSGTGAASVDLRLGTWFVTLPRNRISHLDIIADPAIAEDYAHLAKEHHVPFSKQFFLHPKDFVLASTLEWVRMPTRLAGYLVGRSSWGRRGLIIATAAGVHPGFTGCLTLELSNVGEVTIAPEPGLPICQLFLHEVNTQSELADRSLFLGYRKPLIGSIELDDIAKALARSDVA
jgi:dCTP deaminase